MNFYVSGKLGDTGITKAVMEALKEAGHKITLDWTTIPQLKPYDINAEASPAAAIDEANAVKEADVLVMIPHDKGIGMYVELGIALGFGIPVRVIVLGPSRTIFFHHPLVKRISYIEDLVEEFS